MWNAMNLLMLLTDTFTEVHSSFSNVIFPVSLGIPTTLSYFKYKLSVTEISSFEIQSETLVD